MVLPDGIHILLKYSITVSMSLSWQVRVKLSRLGIKDKTVAVRDWGRGIPLEKWLM
jgi:hypothetical protein